MKENSWHSTMQCLTTISSSFPLFHWKSDSYLSSTRKIMYIPESAQRQWHNKGSLVKTIVAPLLNSCLKSIFVSALQCICIQISALCVRCTYAYAWYHYIRFILDLYRWKHGQTIIVRLCFDMHEYIPTLLVTKTLKKAVFEWDAQ